VKARGQHDGRPEIANEGELIMAQFRPRWEISLLISCRNLCHSYDRMRRHLQVCIANVVDFCFAGASIDK